MIEVSITGIDDVDADLAKAFADSPKETLAVVSRGCLNVKNDWKSRWSGLSHAPALPAAITYDIEQNAAGVRGEIGPVRGKRQAPLDVIIEYGTRNNAPHPGALPSANAEEPRFVSAFEALSARLLP